MKIDTQMQYKFAIESNKKDYNFTITASTEEEAVEEIKKRVVPIHDITGRCCSGIRGVEIYNWINKNVPYEERDTTFRYAILDDDSDMLLWQKDHFFKTEFNGGGLTEEIAQKVISHLNSI